MVMFPPVVILKFVPVKLVPLNPEADIVPERVIPEK